MRLGIVRGHVVLSRSLPSLRGTSLLLVEPVTAANLAARSIKPPTGEKVFLFS